MSIEINGRENARGGAWVDGARGARAATGAACESVTVGSSQIARATDRTRNGAHTSTLSCSAVVHDGSWHSNLRPRGAARSDARSLVDQITRRCPAASITATEARTASRPSRQSWGSSIVLAENETAFASFNGTVKTAPAGIISARPITPSGFRDQFEAADVSSSLARNADNDRRWASIAAKVQLPAFAGERLLIGDQVNARAHSRSGQGRREGDGASLCGTLRPRSADLSCDVAVEWMRTNAEVPGRKPYPRGLNVPIGTLNGSTTIAERRRRGRLVP